MTWRLTLPKRLAILRHAKSDWGDPGLTDFDRPLNARGRAAAAVVGRAIEQRDIRFDAVVSSPAARTRETLELVGLAGSARWDEGLYLAGLKTLLGIIRGLPDTAQSALIVGHNPGLQELVLALAPTGSSGFREQVLGKFPTAALALLEIEAERWDAVEPGGATNAELLLPRDFD